MLGYVALASDKFCQPHGCTFLDKDHLLVCNREGDVTLVHVPEPDAAGREVRVRPHGVINGKGYLKAVVKTPGSAAAYGIGDHRYRAFVSSGQWHFVASHIVTLSQSSRIVDEGIRIENTLQIPDGISLSPDHRWIAVNNHVQGAIQLFKNSPDLDRRTPPDVILEGSVCPHGSGFDAAGNLYVADAASPYVHVYDKHARDWEDRDLPSNSFRLLDNETFYMGR